MNGVAEGKGNVRDETDTETWSWSYIKGESLNELVISENSESNDDPTSSGSRVCGVSNGIGAPGPLALWQIGYYSHIGSSSTNGEEKEDYNFYRNFYLPLLSLSLHLLLVKMSNLQIRAKRPQSYAEDV